MVGATRPAKTEGEIMTEKEMQQFADGVIWRAMLAMQENDIPHGMMFDRILTAAAAHIVQQDGSQRAAEIFHQLADNIGNGALLKVDPKTRAN